jgi:hypothetical protein
MENAYSSYACYAEKPYLSIKTAPALHSVDIIPPESARQAIAAASVPK